MKSRNCVAVELWLVTDPAMRQAYLVVMRRGGEDDRPIARNVVRPTRPSFSEENGDDC